ncbi:MAG: cation diffusion facilitator family transporter [Patescibacteria group bacterium]
MKSSSLTKFAWLSIFTAIVTISLKTIAYLLTGSIGLLSDAIESLVNLAAAVISLIMLRIAEQPPDAEHRYGHSKAEYFASITEGLFIFIAAVTITLSAINRIIHPKIIEQAFLGLGISIAASIINYIVSLKLLKVGKKHRSITLEADGHHLMTDVITSIGVIVAVFLIAITGWQILDPVIAILVAINIIFTGFDLMKRSVLGLLDTSISREELDIIQMVFGKYERRGLKFHGLRTRQSAQRRFVSFHVLVPGIWTVKKGHDLLEKIEKEIRDLIEKVTVSTHLEPVEDPRSLEDISIERD